MLLKAYFRAKIYVLQFATDLETRELYADLMNMQMNMRNNTDQDYTLLLVNEEEISVGSVSALLFATTLQRKKKLGKTYFQTIFCKPLD